MKHIFQVVNNKKAPSLEPKVTTISRTIAAQWVGISKDLEDFKIFHDDVIKCKHLPRYKPFVTGDFPAQRPVTRSFDVSLICAWINVWVNNRVAGDLRRHRAHYEVIILYFMAKFMNAFICIIKILPKLCLVQFYWVQYHHCNAALWRPLTLSEVIQTIVFYRFRSSIYILGSWNSTVLIHVGFWYCAVSEKHADDHVVYYSYSRHYFLPLL